MRCVLFGFLVTWIATISGQAAQRSAVVVDPLPSQLWLQPFQCALNVRSDEGLSNLVRLTDIWIGLSKAEEAQWKAARKQMAKITPLANMPYRELRAYFTDPPDYISPKDRRGLEEIKRWAGEALQQPAGKSREGRLRPIFEMAAAINNNHRIVIPKELGLTDIPEILRHYLHNPVGTGKRPATDLSTTPGPDSSRIDPVRSPFWSPTEAIASQDLYDGYGRSSPPEFTNCCWEYDEPKLGVGISPGFRARFGVTRIKVKLNEIKSEPFTARIFWALGYHPDPVDYVPFLKIRYSRRLLRELHLRHDVPIPVKFFGLTLFDVNFQPRFDPFQFVAEAVLKDGRRISGEELRRRIYRDPDRQQPEEDPLNFRPEVERQIDYLVTCPASVQVRTKHLKSVGPWDFQTLGHENLRELRAAGLIAAWLNWCDSQFQNTRLRLKGQGKNARYEGFFCDLGGGMGQGTGLFFRRLESPNDLNWTFTQAPREQGKGAMSIPFRIVGFKPIADTAAFREMTVDDARWIARRIGQLTESQLLGALVASGFDSAQAKLFLEKLISRRDQMILDLGLGDEIALLRPGGSRRDWSYDPSKDGPIRVRAHAGEIVQAGVGGWVVVRGKVFRRPSADAAGDLDLSFQEPRRTFSEASSRP